jgi:hypothetical protein
VCSADASVELEPVHPLRHALDAAATGAYPPVDGRFERHDPDRPGTAAIVEFTGHSFVLCDEPHEVLAAAGADGFGGASHPAVTQLLAGAHGTIGSHDAVLVAPGTRPATGIDPLPVRTDLDEHPRVIRAREHRDGVVVHGDAEGFVTIGQGLVGRTEISVELLGDHGHHGRGHGRRLIASGLDLIPPTEWVWAQVAPGNAASLRAFLACGFVPVAAETLVTTRR